MMTVTEERFYDAMVEMNIATKEELNLARNLVSGSWEEVLEAVCYIRTGYHTIEMFVECELSEE